MGSKAGITGILFDPAIGGVVNGVTQTIFGLKLWQRRLRKHQRWRDLESRDWRTDLTSSTQPSRRRASIMHPMSSNLRSYASGTWAQLAINSRPGNTGSCSQSVQCE